jgi:hypothetical protein
MGQLANMNMVGAGLTMASAAPLLLARALMNRQGRRKAQPQADEPQATNRLSALGGSQ